MIRLQMCRLQMCRAAAAATLLLLLATLTAAAQTPTGPSDLERIETGQTRTSAGAPATYRIRLLPIASFPDLPPPIGQWLRLRHCMVPQSFEAQQPENVIHGAFRASGSSDWAALCSVAGTTTLYVFFADNAAAPLALRSQPDNLWLGHEPGGSVYGSAWGISVRGSDDLLSSPAIHPAFPIDHDAIDDADLERSRTLLYFHDGKWLDLFSEMFH